MATLTQGDNHEPLSFKCRQTKNLLFGTNGACAVVLNGKVYIGGGTTDVSDSDYVIQVYEHESDAWSQLPDCPVRWFAMVVLNQLLVLVGGSNRAGHYEASLLVSDDTFREWSTPYPDMSTARTSPTAIVYKHFLIVLSGSTDSLSSTTDVEVLDTSNKHWSTAAYLPVMSQVASLTGAVAGDTLYFLGGWEWEGQNVPNKRMFTMPVSSLLSVAASTLKDSISIDEMADADLDFSVSTAVSFKNRLLAVGGKDTRDRRISDIRLYDPKTNQWTIVGHVPTVLSECSCAVLSSGELVVLGGWGENGRNSKKMFFLS